MFLYSFSLLLQHSKGKSAQKIGMSIGTEEVNMIFPKWRNIKAQGARQRAEMLVLQNVGKIPKGGGITSEKKKLHDSKFRLFT